jgi:outer membrane protein assembly complex protein YaeT
MSGETAGDIHRPNQAPRFQTVWDRLGEPSLPCLRPAADRRLSGDSKPALPGNLKHCWLAVCLIFASCSAFHPAHKENPATATAQAGNVAVQLAGVTAFSQGDLRDALSDALDEIKTEGLNAATADDAAFFLELYYRNNGYAFVEITDTINSPKELTLKVNEGPLVTLGDITITGNAHYKDPTNFQQYIIGQTRARFPSSKKVYPYVEADVQKGAELIQRFYLAEGYLDARIGPPVVAYTADRTRANVAVAVEEEGPQYHFGEVDIVGELVFKPDLVRGLIADQIAMPYTKPRVDDMQRKLQGYYKTHGYYNAVVTATSDPLLADADHRVAAAFVVEPGPLYHFDGTRITGTDRLKPDFLRNRFRKLTGQVYDPAKLDELYQQVIKTGLFSLLRVDTVPQPDNTLRLDIGVKEAKAKDIGFSLGYDTFDGPIIGFEIGDRDFRGTGRPITFSVDYSERTLSGELLYKDPYLFETDNQLQLRLSALTRDLDAYDKFEISGFAELVHPFTKQFKVSAFALAKQVDITSYSVAEYNVGRMNYLTDSLGFTVTLDLRDNPVSPTKGLITDAAFALADKDFGGDLNYLRGTYRITYLLPIGKTKQTLMAGFRAGIVAPFDGSDGTVLVPNKTDPKIPGVQEGSIFPIDERFFNGGSTTVRSFGEMDMGPFDKHTGNPIGGQAFTIANVEYDFPMFLTDLRGAVFVDAGNLLPHFQQFGLEDERYAIGAGIRYALPIGPLRLDYGVNPDPRRYESFGAFQLSFGLAF